MKKDVGQDSLYPAVPWVFQIALEIPYEDHSYDLALHSMVILQLELRFLLCLN